MSRPKCTGWASATSARRSTPRAIFRRYWNFRRGSFRSPPWSWVIPTSRPNRDVSATGGLKEKYTDYTAAEIDELWAEREESELTKRLLAENGLPNLAQVFTQRRYVRKDNLAISESYFALLKEKGFFNN